MIPFLQVSIAFLGIVTALALLVLLGRRVGRALFDRAVDRALRRLLKDPYPENLWDLVIGMTRVPPHLLMETELRAETGKMLERPLGSIVRVSDFSAIAFNPAQLVRQPLPPAAPVETSVAEELAEAARALGKTSLRDVGREDLLARTPQAAVLFGLPPTWRPPGER